MWLLRTVGFLVATATLAIGGLTACGDTDDQPATVTVTDAPAVSNSVVAETEDDDDASAAAAPDR